MTPSLLLLAIAATATPGPPDARPVRGGSSATSLATVRILSSVSVGPGRSMTAPGAQHRSTRIDHPGGARPAQLIEFE